jgi:hypothetical protein
MKTRVAGTGVALLFLVSVWLTCGSAARAATTQIIAAGTSQTNLATETVWPGAQNPPYICCWIKQGQFVTFTFTVGGGSTDLALRYTAGNGAISRGDLAGAADHPGNSEWTRLAARAPSPCWHCATSSLVLYDLIAAGLTLGDDRPDTGQACHQQGDEQTDRSQFENETSLHGTLSM